MRNGCAPPVIRARVARSSANAWRSMRLSDALICEKEFATFTPAEGAGAHCESGARAVFNRRSLDWLDGVLGVASPAVE